MLQFRAEHTLIRVLAIYALGVIAGVQTALYLFDFYDDGIADFRSGLIAVLLLFLGLIVVGWSFRKSKR